MLSPYLASKASPYLASKASFSQSSLTPGLGVCYTLFAQILLTIAAFFDSTECLHRGCIPHAFTGGLRL